MRRLAPIGTVIVYLLGTGALATGPESLVVQPVESDTRLILESAPGKARVERQGAAPQRLALRGNELLTTIAETRGGWTAAGVRRTDSESRLILIHRSNQGTRRLSPPALQRHPVQLRPTLAVRGDELEGMAWLEGVDLSSLSVRAASRAHGEWNDSIIVAPPARGSQTGLVAAVLGDGSWLLVWSGFDGQDDEILWSTGRDLAWTVPSRLHEGNSVPDTQPALVSTSGGAIAVWSRLIKGEYRLMLSRFQTGGWSQPRIIGPAGSLEPGFSVQEGQLLLLYRHAWPRGWAITELSAEGRARRLAVVPDESSGRPLLMGSSGETVELRWTDRRRSTLAWEALP